MDKRLSVFIPAYNEEGNIEATISELRSALHALRLEYEIIIVNDGSVDRTGEIAEALSVTDPRIRVVHNPRNLGLAKTFRIGAQSARFEYVGWIPGDNGFPASSLEEWLAPIGEADLIQTYLSNMEVRYIGRRVISRAYTRTMNALFGLNLRYYNGIQVYRRELIQTVESHSDGFALQSEILVKLLAMGNSYIEVGLKMQERLQGESKAVKLKNILDVIKTVVRLFFEVKLIHRSRYRSRGVKLSWSPQRPAVAGSPLGATATTEYGRSA
jgi:glycosyltransferase involved in cell wall biosynthesis